MIARPGDRFAVAKQAYNALLDRLVRGERGPALVAAIERAQAEVDRAHEEQRRDSGTEGAGA